MRLFYVITITSFGAVSSYIGLVNQIFKGDKKWLGIERQV
jgi:hypothetical protein